MAGRVQRPLEPVGSDTGCDISDALRKQITWRKPAAIQQEVREQRAKKHIEVQKAKAEVGGIEVEMYEAARRDGALFNKYGGAKGGTEEEGAYLTEDIDFIRSVLSSGGMDVNRRNPANGRTMLHQAGSDGNKPLLKMLLYEYEADPNARSFLGGDTPLHAAARAGARACCFFLITAGATVQVTNRMRQTPLHFAATPNTALSR